VDPRFLDTKSRPALAQTFEVKATGARFTVVVNHLKSKGSDCNDVGDPDLGDGQGNCSQTRRAAAEALVDWLATDPTGSGDIDFLIMGDLNSYAQEDSIDEIKAGSDDVSGTSDDFTNLIAQFQGTYAYSYTFDGQAGYLDHALANASMLSQVTGAADWHINSDEPDVLDYDTSFKPPSQDALYEVNPYRTSDHDPVVVGLDPNAAPIANADSYTTDEDTPLNIAAPGVLANDTDGNNDTLTAALVSGTTNGMLSLNPDGSFTYTPAPNYNGSDSFTYKASDGAADSNVVTVTITVNAVNDNPVANPDSLTVAKNGSDVVFALANDTDVDGDTLTVVSYTQGAHGTVKYSPKNNNFRYTPAKGFSGTDTFTYTISDGHGGTATATVTITVQ
jgi:VCBS repeat-containing protein